MAITPTCAQKFAQSEAADAARAVDDAARDQRIAALEASVTPTPSTPAAFTLAQVSSVAENGSVVFTVTTPAAKVAANVTLTVSAEPNSAGSSAADWQGGVYPSTTLVFPAGTTSQTFTAYPADDALVEGNETFLAKLSNPTGGASIVSGQIQFDIIDNDTSSSITSPSAYTVPATSARYIQPKSSTAGTWSKGTGGNAASFTAPDATTGIYSPLSSLAAGTYVMPLVFTPTGGAAIAQNVTFTVTANVATGSQTIDTTLTWPGTAGKRLADGVSGWTVSGDVTNAMDDGPVLMGDGSIRMDFADHDPSNSTPWGVFNNIGDQRGGTVLVDHYDTRDGTGAAQNFSILAVDENNRVLVMWSVFGGAPNDDRTSIQGGVYVYSNGARTQVASFNPADNFTSNAHDFVMAIDVSADGNTLGIRSSTSQTAFYTADISTAVKGGTKVGFAIPKDKYGGVDAGVRVRSIKLRKGSNTLTTVTSPGVSANNKAVYMLKWTGSKPGKIDHSLAPVGTTNWGDWLTGDQTINDDGSITYTASFPDTNEWEVRFRQRTDTPVITRSARTMKALNPNSVAFDVFMNVSATNYYFFKNPASIEHERVCQLNLVNNDVVIPGCVGGVGTAARFELRGGNDLAIASFIGENGSRLEDGSSVSSGFSNAAQVSAGVWQLDILANGNGLRAVRCTGSLTPANFTLRRVGETGPTQTGYMDRAGGIGIRALDFECQGPNASTLTIGTKTFPEPKFSDLGGGIYQGNDYGTTPEMVKVLNARRTANPKFRHYFLAMNGFSNNAYYTAHATYLRDNLDPNIIIHLEYLNEVISFPLTGGVGKGAAQRLVKDAFAAGSYGPAGSEAAITNIDWGTGPFIPQDNEGGSGATTKVAAVGDRIAYGLSGMSIVVVKCIQAAPIGTALTNTAYFTVEFNSSYLYDVMNRAFCKKNLELINIFKTVFGSSYSARVRPFLANGGGGIESYDGLANLSPAWAAEIKDISANGYSVDGVNSSSSTVTAQQLYDGVMDSLINYTVPRLTRLARAAADRGKGVLTYEARYHPDYLAAYSNAPASAYKSAYKTFREGPLGYAYAKYEAFVIGSIFPGLWGQFTDFDPIWGLTAYSTQPNDQSQMWLGQRDGLAALRALAA